MAYAEGYYQPLILSLCDLVGRFRHSKDVCRVLKGVANQRMSINEGVEELRGINKQISSASDSAAAVAASSYPAAEGTVQRLFAELTTTVYLLSRSSVLADIMDFASKGGDADKVEEALLMWVRLTNENKDTSAALVPLRDIGRRG